MREIVHLQVGQCGNHIGESFWRLIAQEHGLDLSGEAIHNDEESSGYRNIFFGELPSGKYYARSILADLEPRSVDAITGGSAAKLFLSSNVFSSSNSGSGTFFAKGHYTDGADLCEVIMDAARKEAEYADCLQGFQFTHSIGGGTGSGTTTLLISKLKEEYPDRMFTTFTVVPSPKVSDTVIEPYNATLAIHQLVENADISIMLDNEALFDVCTKKYKISTPSYRDLNALISCAMSNTTCTTRFPGSLNSDMRKIATNLIPFPRLHFFTPSFSPINNGFYATQDLPLMLFDLFDPLNQLVSCDLRSGHFISGVVTVRGQQSQNLVENILANYNNKHSSDFVGWIPDHLKSSCSPVAPPGYSVMCSLLSNNTSIRWMFDRIYHQFEALFRRKAYLWGLRGEGMDEMEFTEAASNLKDLIEEYIQTEGLSEEQAQDEEEDTQQSDPQKA